MTASFTPDFTAASGILLAASDATELVRIVVYTDDAIEPPVQRPVALYKSASGEA